MQILTARYNFTVVVHFQFSIYAVHNNNVRVFDSKGTGHCNSHLYPVKICTIPYFAYQKTVHSYIWNCHKYMNIYRFDVKTFMHTALEETGMLKLMRSECSHTK